MVNSCPLLPFHPKNFVSMHSPEISVKKICSHAFRTKCLPSILLLTIVVLLSHNQNITSVDFHPNNTDTQRTVMTDSENSPNLQVKYMQCGSI